MSGLQLGIDTGGTYTDAVLVDDQHEGADAVVASAKALTTRHDLSQGIGESVDAVMDACPVGASISFVSISTTLATNAIVEGQGGRVCLVAIGFEPSDLERAGLAEAAEHDHRILLAGGHSAQGVERAVLDLDMLGERLLSVPDDVVAYAVVGHFAVRNPEHECAVREAIAATTDLPVTCSHELTAKLNGPKRALTCILNARLIGLISELLAAADELLASRGITCPRMVVRGDGSLVSLDFASRRPIETILSGPAASLVGASFLADAPDAIVSDIGGTTTDVAVLRSGRPEIDRSGATVGGYQTMVEAVAMRTTGLGGDSEVRVADETSTTRLVLGPRRIVPVSAMAVEHPEFVHDVLDRQLARFAVREHDGSFGRLTRHLSSSVVSAQSNGLAQELLEAMSAGPVSLVEALPTRRHENAFTELVASGLAQRISVTPTDAAHVLGFQSSFDLGAAEKALALAARRKDRHGSLLGNGAIGLAQSIVEALIGQSADAVLSAAFAESGLREPGLEQHPLTRAGLAGLRNLVAVDVRLAVPLVSVGASAHAYYPEVAARLNGEAIIPSFAEVANAVGAVVGQVRMTAQATVSPLKKGRFRAHVDHTDYDEFEDAVAHTIVALRERATLQAEAEGAGHVEISVDRQDTKANIDGRDLVVESTVIITASGRPEFG